MTIKERQSHLLKHKKKKTHVPSLAISCYCLHLASGASCNYTGVHFSTQWKDVLKILHIPFRVRDVRSVIIAKENGLLQKTLPWYVRGGVTKGGKWKAHRESYTSWAIHWRNNQWKVSTDMQDDESYGKALNHLFVQGGNPDHAEPDWTTPFLCLPAKLIHSKHDQRRQMV